MKLGPRLSVTAQTGCPRQRARFLQKDADHVSHSYHAPVPYMMRLTQDGVAIHGSVVREGAATHGCIGVPLEFARRLFNAANRGDAIYVIPSRQTARSGPSSSS